MNALRLLLLSSSRAGQTDYLEHATGFITDFLGDNQETLAFIPFAGVAISYDDYESMVQSRFDSMGYNLKSIHHEGDPKAFLENSSAIVVGGGNTFRLLSELYRLNLLNVIQNNVQSGIPYIGWSAGSNIASPTIRTTNDMPIVEPPSFNALNFVPFQINPHYLNLNLPGHNGETRERRLQEFIEINRTIKVVGIVEGTALKREYDKLNLIGENAGVLFEYGETTQELPVGDISRLLI